MQLSSLVIIFWNRPFLLLLDSLIKHCMGEVVGYNPLILSKITFVSHKQIFFLLKSGKTLPTNHPAQPIYCLVSLCFTRLCDSSISSTKF